MNLVFPQCNSDFIFYKGHQVRFKIVSYIHLLCEYAVLPTDKLSITGKTDLDAVSVVMVSTTVQWAQNLYESCEILK